MSLKFKVQSSKFVRRKFQNKFGFHLVGVFLLFTAYCSLLTAQSLPVAAPQTVGMSAEKLNQIDALVEKDIADKKLPGAVVVVGHKGKIVFRKAYGNRSLVPTVEKMTVDTIFDVASLTKPIATTTTSIMNLVEARQTSPERYNRQIHSRNRRQRREKSYDSATSHAHFRLSSRFRSTRKMDRTRRNARRFEKRNFTQSAGNKIRLFGHRFYRAWRDC